jgi:hypothetical protein
MGGSYGIFNTMTDKRGFYTAKIDWFYVENWPFLEKLSTRIITLTLPYRNPTWRTISYFP